MYVSVIRTLVITIIFIHSLQSENSLRAFNQRIAITHTKASFKLTKIANLQGSRPANRSDDFPSEQTDNAIPCGERSLDLSGERERKLNLSI